MKKIFFLFFLAAISGCVIMLPPKGENPTADKYGEYVAPEQYATGIRPDQQPLIDNPNAGNFEFYSQKNGTPLRRANLDSVGRNYRPGIISVDSVEGGGRNAFYYNEDSSSVFFIDFYSQQLEWPLGVVNIYNSDGEIPDGITRQVNVGDGSKVEFVTPFDAGAHALFSIEYSTTDAFVYMKDRFGGTYFQVADNGIESTIGPGKTLSLGTSDGYGYFNLTEDGISAFSGVDGNNFAALSLEADGTAVIKQSTASVSSQIGFLSGTTDALYVEIAGVTPTGNQILVGDGGGFMNFQDLPAPGIQCGDELAALCELTVANNSCLTFNFQESTTVSPAIEVCSDDGSRVTIHGGDGSTNITTSGGLISMGVSGLSSFTFNALSWILDMAGTEQVNVDQDGFGARHVRGLGGAPTISVESGAGTGATAAIVTAQSGDIAGRFSVTTGTGSSGGDDIWATVTFATAFARTPIVIIYNENGAAASIGHFVNVSTSSFEIFAHGTPADLTTYAFSYIVIQGQQ